MVAEAKAKLLARADCGWTQIEKTFYSRRNGRTFRRRWTLYRVEEIGDEGELLGTYQRRGDANKALKKIAHAPEPQR